MTNLNKPIQRRTRDTFGHYRKRIVITLLPGDLIRLHLEKNRIGYTAPISDVFIQLATWHANAEARRKREERKARRRR